MFQYCVYLLYRAGVWLLGLLPLSALFALGQICGAIGWIALPQYRKLALRNVRLALDNEFSGAAARRLVRLHFRRLGANLLCSIKFTQMSAATILKHVQVENFEHIAKCLRANKPLVL